MSYIETIPEYRALKAELQWERLIEILMLGRPHGGMNEKKFVRDFLRPYEPSEIHSPDGDVFAYVVDVGDGTTRTMFSCHIDTVDQTDQSHVVITNGDTITTDSASHCLGADDGAGVWLMLEMIDAKVPGCYVFHRGEERGGIGSSGIAKHHPVFLSDFDRAIAFDRRGTHSIISHQGWSRCCSDEFALALAEAINAVIDSEYFMAPDDGGIFTDTANYTDDIGECTNVSIGYQSEHSNRESLDTRYLFALRDACVAVDWENLPTKRKPGEVDPNDWNIASLCNYRSPITRKEWDYEFDYYKTKDKHTIVSLADLTYQELAEWIEFSDPEDVTEIMYDLLQRN